MRTFEHFNASFDAVCPVCNTSADAETILVPIPGTEEGGICEARKVTNFLKNARREFAITGKGLPRVELANMESPRSVQASRRTLRRDDALYRVRSAHSSADVRGRYLGGFARSMSARNQSRPYLSTLLQCAGDRRIDRCSSLCSGGVGGRPIFLFGSMPRSIAHFLNH